MTKWYINKGPYSDVAVSSRVRLARNFADYPFPFKTTLEQQKDIMNDTWEAVKKKEKELENNFKFINVSHLNQADKLELVEKHIISKELIESRRECGVIISDDEKISIMVNEEDHLRIQCLMSGMQLDEAWKICDRLDSALESSIEFAFDEKIGYLTCCPTNIGTAIRASVMLHLPALIMTGYIKMVLDACGKLGIAVRGLYGENTEAAGNMFQLSNQVTLGKNEKDIIANIKNISFQIIEQERTLREELHKQNKDKFEDKIFRSLGVLRNARLIGTQEALKRLSDVRLGIDMGMIEDIDITIINELMLYIQPGALQNKAGAILEAEERASKRAELIRSKLE